MLDIKRPCVKKCCLNEEDICVGCFRSLDDMRKWHKSTDDAKLEMLKVANERSIQAKQLVLEKIRAQETEN